MSIQLPPAIFSSTLYSEGQKLVYTKQFPSDLIAIFTPPSIDINIDQYRKEYVDHKKSLQLSQLGKSIDHVVHEHQLDDEIVDSVVHPSTCSLCSTSISSDEKVFFCSTCQYAECKVCYPNHSGRDQQLSASIAGDNAMLSQGSDESVGTTTQTDDVASNATDLIKSGSLETNDKDDDNDDDDDDVPENIPIDDLPDLVFVGTDETNPHLHQIGSLYRHQFHRHQLQYLTSMKDGIDYMCAECQTKGSGYVYVCPSPRCSYYCHPSCLLPYGYKDPKASIRAEKKAEALAAKAAQWLVPDQSYENVILHQHPLTYKLGVYIDLHDGRYGCDICKNNCDGPAYQCSNGCPFDVCPDCFEAAIGQKPKDMNETIQMIGVKEGVDSSNPHNHKIGDKYFTVDHPHPLTYKEKAPYEQAGFCFGCDICTIGGTGTVYHCEVCTYDLHPRCFRLKAPGVVATPQWEFKEGMGIKASNHPNCILVWTKGAEWQCDSCSGSGYERFHCAKCDCNLHSYCVAEDY